MQPIVTNATAMQTATTKGLTTQPIATMGDMLQATTIKTVMTQRVAMKKLMVHASVIKVLDGAIAMKAITMQGAETQDATIVRKEFVTQAIARKTIVQRDMSRGQDYTQAMKKKRSTSAEVSGWRHYEVDVDINLIFNSWNMQSPAMATTGSSQTQ